MALPTAIICWPLWVVLSRTPPDGHAILAAMHDRYFGPAERTARGPERLGLDLATGHEDTWDGRPAYVVGARRGDLRTRQFWVDKDRLLFVRLLEPGQRDTTRTSDIRFNDYRPVGAAWVSAEVAFLVDGHQRWLEQYAEISTGTALSDALFD